MTSVAIPTRYPTLVKTAVSTDQVLGMMGEFVWPPDKGPVENILRLVDFGLILVLPFPMQAITLVASLFGYDLQALGRVIDRKLSLSSLKDLSKTNMQDATFKLLNDMPVEEQMKALKEFRKLSEQAGKTAQSSFPLTSKNIETMEKGLAVEAGASSLIIRKLIKDMGTKGTVVAAMIAFVAWLIKTAGRLIAWPFKTIWNNPGKTLLAAGAASVAAVTLYDKDYDPKKDEGDDKGAFGALGDVLDGESKKLTRGKPTTFRGKIEQQVDQTIMGAY